MVVNDVQMLKKCADIFISKRNDKREQEKCPWPSRTKALWAGLSQGVRTIYDFPRDKHSLHGIELEKRHGAVPYL